MKVIGFYGHFPNKPYACFSNFYPSTFELNGITYFCMEQYIMYQKALTFCDYDTAEKIMQATTPNECKSLGRQVKHYVDEIWSEDRKVVAFEGLIAKFSQNPELKRILLSTKDSVIAECSPYDKIWGIGLDVNHPDVQDVAKWRGENLLGYSLMKVRDLFINA